MLAARACVGALLLGWGLGAGADPILAGRIQQLACLAQGVAVGEQARGRLGQGAVVIGDRNGHGGSLVGVVDVTGSAGCDRECWR